ncbi:MAG: GDSL-type esterase/lipase family protein [Bacteroidota bacterium]
MLCNGQDGAVSIDRYPFVNYELNNIQFFKDSLDFYGFFRKLDKLITTGKGKINIAHFGGSHVQADMWTGRLRDNFNEFLNQKQAARGWVYPFKMGFKSNNNPSGYAFEWSKRWDGCRAVNAFCSGNIGMNAITTVTHDSDAGFTVIMKNEHKTDYVFDRIKVFYDNHHQSFQIVLDSPYVAKQIIDNKEAGYREFIFEEPMHQVSFRCAKTDSLQNVFMLYGLYCDLDAPGINYNAIGANGASIPTYLKCNFLEKELAEIKPDLIIFSVGINDAFDPNFCQSCFERNYEELIKRIKKVAPNAAILFTTNTDSYKKTRKGKFYQNITGLEVKSAMRNLSAKYNTGVWDLFSIMGGLGSIEFWARNGMASNKDRVHFSARGYRVIGDLMFVALIRKYEEYLKLPIAKIKHE